MLQCQQMDFKFNITELQNKFPDMCGKMEDEYHVHTQNYSSLKEIKVLDINPKSVYETSWRTVQKGEQLLHVSGMSDISPSFPHTSCTNEQIG